MQNRKQVMIRKLFMLSSRFLMIPIYFALISGLSTCSDSLPVFGQTERAGTGFEFNQQNDEHLNVLLNRRKLLRFVHRSHDGTSQQSHYQTYKPFHQVFSPSNDSILLTSGIPDLDQPHQYPHHRGIFFGFNRISYDGNQADTWHATDNVYTSCERLELGPIDDQTAAHTATIGWHGKDGHKFAEERRTVIVHNVDDGIQLDWITQLKSLGSVVKLDGDPQHAGMHFRAHQSVALEYSDQTYFLRPDGKGEIGEERNWTPQNKDSRTINLPWNAMSFVLGDQRYTVLRIAHRDNPTETRGSERAYGRFGDYFEYELSPENPLSLKYRFWIKEGEMSVDQADEKYREFNQD